MRKYVTVTPSKTELTKTRTQNMGFASRFTSKVSPEDFVKAWLSSRTLQDVADKTGMTYAAVGTRARQYIKKGINLPPLSKVEYTRPGLRRVPVADLNELIELATTRKE